MHQNLQHLSQNHQYFIMFFSSCQFYLNVFYFLIHVLYVYYFIILIERLTFKINSTISILNFVDFEFDCLFIYFIIWIFFFLLEFIHPFLPILILFGQTFLYSRLFISLINCLFKMNVIIARIINRLFRNFPLLN